MLIKDLKNPCDPCKSTGFVAGFNEYGTHRPNTKRHCLHCNGRGYLLTEFGEEMLSVFKPFLKQLVQEELSGKK